MSLKHFISRRRLLQKPFGFLLPEVLRLPIVSDFQLYVDPRDVTGPSFYVSYGGPAAFYHYEEAEKAELIQDFPSEGVFIDVGANIGLFSFSMARIFKQAKVFAFEPHPILFRCLQETRRANQIQNFSPLNAALGAGEGKIELILNRRDSGGHSTRSDQISGHDQNGRIQVELRSLDRFVSSQKLMRVDAIKMDVQGAEWSVLQGARETILRFRPKMLIEFENAFIVDHVDELGQYFVELPFYRVKRAGEIEWREMKELLGLARADLERGILYTNFVLNEV